MAGKRAQRASGGKNLFADPDFRLDPTIRPERYDFTLTVDPQARRFHGTGTIQLKLTRPTSLVALHAVGLAVLDAKAVGAKGEVASSVIARHAASEAVAIQFEAPLAAGKWSLDVSWAGKFSTTLAGLYPSDPRVAITQFEAADARKVFPCFDEPSFKARWQLSLRVPKGMTALANGAAERSEDEGAQTLHRFKETPALSSYLIAIAVGDLVGSDTRTVRGAPVRTWTTPEKANLTRFAQDTAEAVLPLLEDYFGLPYAYGKVDQVGVPGFEAGAMENAGLITFRETALLVDPETTPLLTQKRIADVITHELAHQWYGNLVTMAWWDDLWLNEAFATWMAAKIVDQYKPEWRTWLEFDTGTETAMSLDALKSTHPIRYEVSNAHKAGESFDAITYEKGAAILRMMENYLGETAFRSGIQAYMRKHQGGNTVAGDLWGALQAASKQPVGALAKAWIDRGGFPLVELELDGDSVSVRQTRFFSEAGAKSSDKWPVPMILRYQEEGSLSREHRVIFSSAKQKLKLPGKGVRWVCANARATGFYRVTYGKKARAALLENLNLLTEAERAALVRDTLALVTSRREDPSVLFEVVDRLGEEKDHAVLDAVVGALGALERLVSPALAPAFRTRVGGLFTAAAQEMGWQSPAGEGNLEKQRRAALMRAAAVIARDGALAKDAQARLGAYLDGKTSELAPDVHPHAVTAAARVGDAKLFERLQQRYEAETNPILKRRYLAALATFEAPELAQRGLKVAQEWKVPGQEFGFYVETLMLNPTAREATWGWLQKSWPEIQKRSAGPSILRAVIKSFVHLPDPQQLKEVTTLLAKHSPKDAKQVVDQTLERMKQLAKLRPAVAKSVTRWTRAE